MKIYKDLTKPHNQWYFRYSPEIQIQRNWPQICLAAFPVLSSENVDRLIEFYMFIPFKDEVAHSQNSTATHKGIHFWHLEMSRSINENRFLQIFNNFRKLNYILSGTLAAWWFSHNLDYGRNCLKSSWSYHHCRPYHSNSREHLIMFRSAAIKKENYS